MRNPAADVQEKAGRLQRPEEADQNAGGTQRRISQAKLGLRGGSEKVRRPKGPGRAVQEGNPRSARQARLRDGQNDEDRVRAQPAAGQAVGGPTGEGKPSE
uniref:(northern house mosquito) hypothetical protein n=1 Tax=Culex pipiens TaxID=7175 RepID=A0A8D8I714_CULPI